MTFARRPLPRMNRGRVAASRVTSGASALDPLSIVSATNVFWLIGDLGCSGSLWTNQGPTGATGNATQGTGAAQPAYNATELGGRGVLTLDGTDDTMQFANLTLPNPTGAPRWFWGVIRQTNPGWTNGDRIYSGAGSTTYSLRQATASPQISMNNGVAGPLNNGAALNTWVRIENLLNFNTTDYVKAGSVSVTGTNTGTSSAALGTFFLGSNGSSAFWAGKFAALGCWEAEPSAGQKTALDAWCATWYGGLVGL